jgi:hypothetical protein
MQITNVSPRFWALCPVGGRNTRLPLTVLLGNGRGRDGPRTEKNPNGLAEEKHQAKT